MEYIEFNLGNKDFSMSLEHSRFNVAKSGEETIIVSSKREKFPATGGECPYYEATVYSKECDCPAAIADAITELDFYVYKAGYTYRIPEEVIASIESKYGVKLHMKDKMEQTYFGGGGFVPPRPGPIEKVGEEISAISFNGFIVNRAATH